MVNVETISALVCGLLAFEQPPIVYPTDLGPESIVSGDFNKDGHLDLAISNYNGNIVSIFLGIGNGSFQSYTINFASNGNNPYELVTRDFNNDGSLDLALCNEGSNTVSVLLGLGNGSFRVPATTFPSGGSLPSSITAADLNADGKIDLVVTNTGSDNIAVFLGKGNGTFQWPGISYATGSLPSSITNGDFNDDGVIDLAVVSRNSDQLLIFFGLGNGTFSSNTTSYSTQPFPYAVRSADLNGDSKLDLVVANFHSNSISIFMGANTGILVMASPTTYNTTGIGPIGIAIQDLNGDSVMDLAISNQFGNSITVYLGIGNGTFAQRKQYSSMGQVLKSIIAQDFNEDGMYDLAVANQDNNTVSILLAQCI